MGQNSRLKFFVSGPKFTRLFFAVCGKDCSRSSSFTIFDILIRSKDIRDIEV